MPVTRTTKGASADFSARPPLTAEQLRALTPEIRAAFLASITEKQAEWVKYWWEFWARPEQLAPQFPAKSGGDWFAWVYLAGRGAGKTRTGSELVRRKAMSGRYRFIGIAGQTADATRAIQVEGESGILSVCPPWERPKYEPANRRLIFPTGTIVTLYSADEPERFRGPQYEFFWADEVASWRYPESWDQIILGTRLGLNPQIFVSTTPKPVKFLKELLADSSTAISRGTTYDNASNLAANFLRQIKKKYEGTRMGRQELLAAMLMDTPGALWNEQNIEQHRILPTERYHGIPVLPDQVELFRIVIGVDPAGSIQNMTRYANGLATVDADRPGDQAGIVAVGHGDDYRGYTLADRTTSGSPEAWGNATVDLYLETAADCIAVEYNHGGEVAEEVIQVAARNRGLDRLPVKRIWASRGKYIRAEPIAQMYEQGRFSHVGTFDELEDELVNWVPPGASPNRLDALVIAATELFLGGGGPGTPAMAGPREQRSILGGF